jgi:hypothetical protein
MSQLSVDSITGRAAGTSPTFPNGLNVTNGMNVTGVVTATILNQTVAAGDLQVGTGVTIYGNAGIVSATSFRGDGSQLSGVDASSLKDGSNVKVQAVSGGADVTGDLGVSGNATVTGNLTVNGTTTTIDTAITAVDSLAVDGDVNVGAAISAADYEGNFVLDMYLFS